MHASQPESSPKLHPFFLLPRSRAGKLAVVLAGGVIGFLIIFFGFVAAGERGGDEFFDNLRLTIPILLAAASGLGAGFVGLWAVIVRHERSIYVFGAAIVGLIVIVFGIGELVGGH